MLWIFYPQIVLWKNLQVNRILILILGSAHLSLSTLNVLRLTTKGCDIIALANLFLVFLVMQVRLRRGVGSGGVPEKVSQFSSVAQSCLTLCDPTNRSTPGLPVHYQLPEFTQTHVHRVSDAIQPSHLLSSPSPPASNPSQHQSLFQWVNSSHEVAKVLEFQL